MSWLKANAAPHWTIQLDVPPAEMDDPDVDEASATAFVWSGRAADGKAAMRAARSTLRTVAAVLSKLTGGRPPANVGAWSARDVSDAATSDNETFSLWPALAERFEETPPKRTWDYDQLDAVMTAALRSEAARLDHIGHGATIAACFSSEGPGKGLRKTMSIDLFAIGGEAFSAPPALRVVQEAVATAWLARNAHEGIAYATLALPDSATLRAALHQSLRARKAEDDGLVASFLDHLGLREIANQADPRAFRG